LLSSYNSFIEPTQTSLVFSVFCQTGIADHQYLFLEIFQSFAHSTHLPNLPVLIISGTQFIFILFATILSLIFSTATYQAEIALYISGLSHLQQ